jgi:hypothetical protein
MPEQFPHKSLFFAFFAGFSDILTVSLAKYRVNGAFLTPQIFSRIACDALVAIVSIRAHHK